MLRAARAVAFALAELRELKIRPRPERPPETMHALFRLGAQLAGEEQPGGSILTSLDLPLPVESAPTPEAPAPEAPTSYGALTPSAANVEPSETQPSVEAPRPPIV